MINIFVLVPMETNMMESTKMRKSMEVAYTRMPMG